MPTTPPERSYSPVPQVPASITPPVEHNRRSTDSKSLESTLVQELLRSARAQEQFLGHIYQFCKTLKEQNSQIIHKLEYIVKNGPEYTEDQAIEALRREMNHVTNQHKLDIQRVLSDLLDSSENVLVVEIGKIVDTHKRQIQNEVAQIELHNARLVKWLLGVIIFLVAVMAAFVGVKTILPGKFSTEPEYKKNYIPQKKE